MRENKCTRNFNIIFIHSTVTNGMNTSPQENGKTHGPQLVNCGCISQLLQVLYVRCSRSPDWHSDLFAIRSRASIRRGRPCRLSSRKEGHLLRNGESQVIGSWVSTVRSSFQNPTRRTHGFEAGAVGGSPYDRFQAYLPSPFPLYRPQANEFLYVVLPRGQGSLWKPMKTDELKHVYPRSHVNFRSKPTNLSEPLECKVLR